MARARKQNTLYVMHAWLCQGEANVTADTVGELWLKRLGHMSQIGMQMLAEKEFLPGIRNMHLEKCINCLIGKQNRVAFHPRLLMRRKNALELVHIYVCYVDAKSHAGAQCFVTFIDYYNRKLWAFVLKTKDQVLSVFKEFQARAKREFRMKVERCPDRQWW